jgi:hypothetical protein
MIISILTAIFTVLSAHFAYKLIDSIQNGSISAAVHRAPGQVYEVLGQVYEVLGQVYEVLLSVPHRPDFHREKGVVPTIRKLV